MTPLLPADALLAVLAAAFLHASWNAIAKGGAGRHAFTGPFLISLGGAVWALPVLVVTGLPDPGSYPWIGASALIHVVYFGLIGLAYRYADYSAVYPLIRGGAPLFTTIFAAVFLGETLGFTASAGVALLCAGILGLGLDGVRRGSLDRRSLLVAAATASMIVLYTLVDGLGARASGNAAAYIVTLTLATLVPLVPVFAAIGGRPLLASLQPGWKQALLGGGDGEPVLRDRPVGDDEGSDRPRRRGAGNLGAVRDLDRRPCPEGAVRAARWVAAGIIVDRADADAGRVDFRHSGPCRMKKAPGCSPRPLRSSTIGDPTIATVLPAGAGADHEVVVGVLGHLEPEIFLVPEARESLR